MDMENKPKKPGKLNKGMPSAVVLSIAIHAALFLLAGMLVVFTVKKVNEPEFEAPKAVERPKMKLRKPKVNIKKTSKPKSTRKIVTQKPKAMSSIQLPALSGIGDGLGDGGGIDFGGMPDIDNITALGSTESIGNDLKGVYYDLKFTRSGRYAPVSMEEWRGYYRKFCLGDWDPKIFSKFYKAPIELYTTYLTLPPSISAMAPVAFGIPDHMTSGGFWIVIYKGKLVHKDGITFRFWASPDDSLAIRLDGKIVVAASFISPKTGERTREHLMYDGFWKSTSPDTGKYQIGHSLATVGDWVTLEPGVPMDIEVIATDNAYAIASYVVAVEEKGKEYPRGRHHGPLLPLFKTEELTHDQLDIIYQSLAEDEVDCVNGPIFRDF